MGSGVDYWKLEVRLEMKVKNNDLINFQIRDRFVEYIQEKVCSLFIAGTKEQGMDDGVGGVGIAGVAGGVGGVGHTHSKEPFLSWQQVIYHKPKEGDQVRGQTRCYGKSPDIRPVFFRVLNFNFTRLENSDPFIIKLMSNKGLQEYAVPGAGGHGGQVQQPLFLYLSNSLKEV